MGWKKKTDLLQYFFSLLLLLLFLLQTLKLGSSVAFAQPPLIFFKVQNLMEICMID